MLGKINLELICFIGVKSSWGSVDFDDPSSHKNSKEITNIRKLIVRKIN